MSETNVSTVTITIDEYFDLRQKAETNLYLMTELARLDARLNEFDRRLWDIERKINNE